MLDCHCRIRAEVDHVLGDKQDITWEDLDRLEYVHAVFKETLRLFPVAPATVREVKNEETLDGVRIPGGTPLMVSTTSEFQDLFSRERERDKQTERQTDKDRDECLKHNERG